MPLLDTTTRTKPAPCWSCGNTNDAVTGNDGSSPSPGDVALCIRCGALSVFDDALRQRPPTREAEAQAIADPEVARFRVALAQAQGRLVGVDVFGKKQ